jgi:hypothetical protein
MKERPILFSGPMIRAILEGRKTQTRRIVNPQPFTFPKQHPGQREIIREIERKGNRYGQPGERLWVRETWRQFGAQHLYRADFEPGKDVCAWKPSIHMPRFACRLLLEITSIRVERLQSISENDAVAEGIEPLAHLDIKKYGWRFKDYIGSSACLPIASFQTLWQSINGPESWNQNPWVWVIEFKRIEP